MLHLSQGRSTLNDCAGLSPTQCASSSLQCVFWHGVCFSRTALEAFPGAEADTNLEGPEVERLHSGASTCIEKVTYGWWDRGRVSVWVAAGCSAHFRCSLPHANVTVACSSPPRGLARCSCSPSSPMKPALRPASSELPPLCYNNCGDWRGTCIPSVHAMRAGEHVLFRHVDGTCRCEAPWHGYDCAHLPDSLRKVASRSGAGSGIPRGFLYVLSPPDHLGLRSAHRHARHSPKYAAESFFVQRMLSDPRLRTTRLEDARLFYVPTWAVYAQGNIAYHHNRNHLLRLMQWISHNQTSPELVAASRDTSRLVFFFAGDRGACRLARGPIFITHWGLTTPMQDLSSDEPCCGPRDVVVPPAGHFFRAKRPANQSFRCELFFRGSIATAPGSCFSNSSSPDHCWEQAVRRRVSAHHSSRPGFCVQGASELFAASRFCLAPSGVNGFGDRLSESLLAGCVPVIIQPFIRLPFEDILNYSSFSLRLSAREIPNLHHILRSIPDDAHAHLQASALRVSRAFWWGETPQGGLRASDDTGVPGGLAYAHTRYMLCLRAGLHSCKHLRRDPELPLRAGTDRLKRA